MTTITFETQAKSCVTLNFLDVYKRQLYALAVSNDIGAAMMEGNAGKSLVKEVIKEAVEFRQEIGKLYKEYTAKGDWFFKPWNAEKVTDPKTKKVYDFEKAPKELLIEEQDCWVMHPEEDVYKRQLLICSSIIVLKRRFLLLKYV